MTDYTGFRFGGQNAVLSRPADKPPIVTGDTWARDRSSLDTDDGTEIDATFLNRLKANLEAFVVALGGDLNDGDDQLANAMLTALALYTTSADLATLLAAKSNTGHTHAVSSLSDGGGFVRMTDAERSKLAALVANYKGSYASLSAVASANPTATAGDWAVISKPGDDASIAVWDADATPSAAWVDIDSTPPATAASTPFTPAGNLAATNVQAALQELDTEKQPVTAFATQVEAEAGASSTVMLSPLGAAQHLAKNRSIKQIIVDKLGSSQTTTSNGTVLFTSSELVIVDTTCKVQAIFMGGRQCSRSAAGAAGDFAFQERTYASGAWGSWTTVLAMQGYHTATGATAVEFRDTPSCFYERASLTGLARVQYRVISSNLNTSPAESLTMVANSVFRLEEFKP